MINNIFKHNKVGTALFNICAKWTKFLVKHKWLYFLLTFTWGGLSTIIGGLILTFMAFLSIFNIKISIRRYKWNLAIQTPPKYWGGMSMSPVFLRDLNSSSHVSAHELGHSFQNCLFGPFIFLIVSIPSAIRWWVFNIRLKKRLPVKAYDSIWFEDSATQCGLYASSKIN